MVDIAEAAHVTPRALHPAFRRHLDVTPMSHLRAMRLELVRHALLDVLRDESVSVRSVAKHFGFADYGRFTTLYKHRFAESPVDILRG